jgi:hypothetical protein
MFSQFLLFMWVLQSLVAALVGLCAVDPGSCGKNGVDPCCTGGLRIWYTVVGTCFFVRFGEKIVAVSESSFLIYGVDVAMRRNSL